VRKIRICPSLRPAQKPKVVCAVEDLGVGGIERGMASLAFSLPKDRYDVRVWCLTRGGITADEIKKAGIPVEILGMGREVSFSFVNSLRKKLRAEKISILHAHGYTAATVGRAAAILAGTPVIISHVHTTYGNLGKKQLLTDRLLSYFTDKIICCSKAVLEFCAESEKISRRKLRVVYNGTAPMSLPPEPKGFVIGCVGSLTPHKGQEHLLKALPGILPRFPQARLLLVGDGPLRGELETLAEKLGIGGSVEFSGIVPDVRPFLSKMSVAVQPSCGREGLSLSLVEAMSAGIPLVGTRVGGIPEVISHGENGLLVPPADAAAIAQAVISILSDGKKAAAMAEAGLKIYAEKFTLEKMTREITGIYDELYG